MRARRCGPWSGRFANWRVSIQDQDVKLLATFPGIGEATAERIVAKLRRKVGKFALIVSPESTAATAGEANGTPDNAEPDVIRDTYAALLSVGHSESDARQAIDRVIDRKKEIQVRGRYD